MQTEPQQWQIVQKGCLYFGCSCAWRGEDQSDKDWEDTLYYTSLQQVHLAR